MDVHAVDQVRCPAVLSAVRAHMGLSSSNMQQVILAMLQAGADPGAVDRYGKSTLSYAAAEKPDLAELRARFKPASA